MLARPPRPARPPMGIFRRSEPRYIRSGQACVSESGRPPLSFTNECLLTCGNAGQEAFVGAHLWTHSLC